MGEESKGLLLSVFGGDNEIAAIAAAATDKATFTLQFPDGETELNVSMGDNSANFKGSIVIPGLKHPVRHLVVVSQSLRQNGLDGATYLLNYTEKAAWSLLVSTMGLPAAPGWGEWVMDRLDSGKRVVPVTGFGCTPMAIRATRDEVLEWLGEGVKSKSLEFPHKNGPIVWPQIQVSEVISPFATSAA